MLSSPVVVLIGVIATGVVVATPEPSDLRLSPTSSTASTSSSQIALRQANCETVVQALADANVIIRLMSSDGHESEQKAADSQLCGPVPTYIMSQIEEPRPDFTRTGCFSEQMEAAVNGALSGMFAFLESDGEVFPDQDWISDQILSLITTEDKFRDLNAPWEQLTSLKFIGDFLNLVLQVDDFALDVEAFAFIPFLLRHFSDAALRLHRLQSQQEFILPLLLLFNPAAAADYDRSQWDQFLDGNNSLHSRLYAVQTLTKADSMFDILRQSQALNRDHFQLSDLVSLFVGMLPGPARQQIRMELVYYIRTRAQHSELRSHMHTDHFDGFEPRAIPGLAFSILQSPQAIHFIDCLRPVSGPTSDTQIPS